MSWQVVPPVLGQLLHDEDQEKSHRVMQAMLQMNKLDMKTLKQAYAGNGKTGKTPKPQTKQAKL